MYTRKRKNTIHWKKTVWNPSHTGNYHFFCPQCRKERQIGLKPSPWQGKYLFRVALTSAVIAMATSPVWGIKGAIIFVPLWAAFEIYYRLKVRSLLSCPYCGFDPYLYITDVKRARKEMERFWREKFSQRGIPYPGDEEPPLTSDPSLDESSEDEVGEQEDRSV